MKKNISIIFIIINTLLFFVVIDGFNLVNKWKYEMENDILNDYYRYSVCLSFCCSVCGETTVYDGYYDYTDLVCDEKEHLKQVEKILPLFSDRNATVSVNSNVLLSGYPDYIPIRYIFSYESPYFLHIDKGRNITVEDFEEKRNVAIISSEIEHLAIKKGEDYFIKIGGDYYQVVGIYEPPYFDYREKAVVSYYPEKSKDTNVITHMADSYWRGISHLQIDVESDTRNMEELYEVAKDISNDLNVIGNIEAHACKNYSYLDYMTTGRVYDTADIDKTETELDEEFYLEASDEVKLLSAIALVLFIFCLLCYIQTIGLYVKSKERLYTIYRINGFSKLKITEKIMKELLPMMLISVVIAAILSTIYNKFIVMSEAYAISIYGVAFIVIITALILLISILVILFKISRINLVERIMDL